MASRLHAGQVVLGNAALLLALVCSNSHAADLFRVVLADLSRDEARVAYGTLSLTRDGRLSASMWTVDGAQPLPGEHDIAPGAPRVPLLGGPARDETASVVVHPAAFAGPPERTAGNWALVSGGLAVTVEGWPALELRRLSGASAAEPVYAVVEARPDGRLMAGVVIGTRSHMQQARRLAVRPTRLEGYLVRLNAWEPNCTRTTWAPTSLTLGPGGMQMISEGVWRAVSNSLSPRHPNRNVLSYLWMPEMAADGSMRAHVHVSHDFNGNGRIDDDWGHLYTGFALPAADGSLRALLLADFSPVGLRGRPHATPCRSANGTSLTHTLGLLVYVDAKEPIDWQSVVHAR